MLSVQPTSPRKIELNGKKKSLKKIKKDKCLKNSGGAGSVSNSSPPSLRSSGKRERRKKKEKTSKKEEKGKEKIKGSDYEDDHEAAKDNSPRGSLELDHLSRHPSTIPPPPPPPPPAPPTIDSIPEELLVHILSFLPHFPNLISCSTVCKKWRGLVNKAELWREVYLGRYEKIASDRLVVWIATLNPSLQTLSLKGCTQVTDVGLTAVLGRCSNLKGLYLEDLERQFSVRCLLMIGKLCPHLDTLVLPSILENPDEVLQQIVSCCSNLRVFKSFSQFSESTFKCLAETCTGLEKIRFGTTTKSTILSQNAVKYIAKLPNLKSLECGYFSMGEVDWGRKPLHNFKSFRAFGWLDISPGALRSLLKNTPNLETLHLIHSGGEEELVMSTFKFDYISQFCPRLENVNLCDTPFCENDVQTIVRECRELKELRVGMKSNPGTNFELTDSWIYQVINFSPKIEVLKIYHANIRANTVPMLTRGCKNLRSLTLGKCSEIKEITSHLEILNTLERLSLRNTPVHDSALQMMMSAIPYLQTLTLIETGVSNAMIGFIVGRYRLQSIKLQPRSRLTAEGKILYRGRPSRGRFVKKQALTPQENIFLNIFKTQQTTEAMIKKRAEKKRFYTNN